jgi:hypothetical protein
MSPDWFEPIRSYCERTGPDLWAEPLNAATNGAFLVAALLAARRTAAAPADRPCLALAVLTGIVGIGSFLFHTLALRWAMLADVIPIALFINGYFWLAMRHLLGLGAAQATGATLAFLAASFALTPALEALAGRPLAEASNGSIDYLPAILALIGVAAALLAGRPRSEVRHEAGQRLLAVAGLFLTSLTARTLDRAVCAAFPAGTHWLWHLLNACVLYALIVIAIRVRRRPA